MEFKSFMEALKGKQHKIDKNKNGQIDAHDFKLLRKEETEELDESTYASADQAKSVVAALKQKHNDGNYSVKQTKNGHKVVHAYDSDAKVKSAIRLVNEETEELDEIRRMKTKLNTLDDISNKSVARQKLSNLMKSGKARGALIANKMRTLNMGDDLDQEDLDALHEVLSKDAKAGDYISDFVHSTNPKFDGKSKKERINMALGAYYSTHKKKDGVSEGYQSHSGRSHGNPYGGGGFGRREREDDEYHVPDPTPVAPVPAKKYIKGTPENQALKASRKPINGMPTEEVEQIEEKSEQAKQNKTMKNMMDASRGARHKLNNPVPAAEPEHKTARAHNVAIGRALRSEDKMTTTKDKSGKIISFKYEGDWKKTTKADVKKDPAGKVANMAGQAMQKMAKANEQAPVAPVPDRKYIKGTPEHKAYKATKKPINGMPTNKMTEEKDEQEYGYEGDMAMNQLSTLIRCAEMIKDTLKPDTDLPEWVQSKITLASDYIVTAADYLHSELEEGYYEKPASAYRRKGDEVGGGSSKAVSVKVNAAGDAPHEEKWEAVKKIKKPVKESFDDEGNLIANKVSYKEFMLEYTPGPGGVTQIKGRSYGASYTDPEGADDYDDKKPMKPAAEKRGRGRPAGAKSGARKITGTSKLMNK